MSEYGERVVSEAEDRGCAHECVDVLEHRLASPLIDGLGRIEVHAS
jgi:hypothetical protein